MAMYWITAMLHTTRIIGKRYGHWKHEMRPEIFEALELLGVI